MYIRFCAGNTNVVVGLADGRLLLHGLKDMDNPVNLDQAAIRHQGTVWTVASICPGVLATGGEDGNLIVWRIDKPVM